LARNLSRKLITFAKGGQPVSKPQSIRSILEDTVSFALAGSNVECTIQIPDGTWMVEVDDTQISQAIQNILLNAREAMPNGGMVRVTTENIRHGERKGHPVDSGDWVCISIQDQGVGIAREHQERIFDPYFTTKEMGAKKGLGLGLAISHSVIRNHKGHITVDSEPERGSTFRIYLPAFQPDSAVEARERRVHESTEGKARILVMDDEEVVREIACKMLSRIGYDVFLARHGEEALQIFTEARSRGESFDAVLLDLTVRGGMGGKEAVIRLLEIDRNVRAIVTSGYSEDPVVYDYASYGFKAVAIKPYTISELKEILDRVLADRRPLVSVGAPSSSPLSRTNANSAR
jgi:CheY-like chemotaxis protein